MSDKFMKMDTPDAVVNSMKIAGGSLSADSAPDDDPAGRSSDVSSIACVQNQIPTVVSVQTVVSEKWMDRFVFGLVECSSVSRTSAVARTFGTAVSEEYSPVVFAGGGGGGRLPMHAPWSS